MAKIINISIPDDDMILSDIKAVEKRYGGRSAMVRAGLQALLDLELSDSTPRLDGFIKAPDTIALPSVGMGHNERMRYLKQLNPSKFRILAAALDGWTTDMGIMERHTFVS